MVRRERGHWVGCGSPFCVLLFGRYQGAGEGESHLALQEVLVRRLLDQMSKALVRIS